MVQRNGNGPELSYATVITTLGFAASVVYGIWALNQSQLADVRLQIDLLRKETSEKDARVSAELARRENELRAANEKQDLTHSNAIKNIQEELDRRRDQFVAGKTFGEFQARILDEIKTVRAQVTVLEQSRPITGELQAVTAALRDRIDRLYEMVRQQEEWIRTRPNPPVQQR